MFQRCRRALGISQSAWPARSQRPHQYGDGRTGLAAAAAMSGRQAGATEEFDCADCGRHISSPDGAAALTAARCSICFTWPGWHLIAELRRLLAPDDNWSPPSCTGASAPTSWCCEVPGCPNREALFRISRYDEPFRGRCADHLHPEIWQRLHAACNRD